MVTSIKRFLKNGDVHLNFFKQLHGAPKILEIGCGRGGNCIPIHAMHPHIEIHGVDIIEKVLVPDFVQYQSLDLEQNILPYSDNYFDAVLIIWVLEHLHDPFALCKEIRRIMKKGSLLFVEVPNWTTIFIPSFGFKRKQYNPFNFFDDPTHVRIWTKQSLFQFMNEGCATETPHIRVNRNIRRIPLGVLRIVEGLIRGNRGMVILEFWNLFGWCIYGIGRKV